MPFAGSHSNSRSTAVAIGFFLIAAFAAEGLVWRFEQYRLQHEHATAAGYAADRAQTLRMCIERAMAANFALALLVRQSNGSVPNFATVADEMLPFYPGASELALAPHGVIGEVAPLQGNEKALGLDVLSYPPQHIEAEISRNSGKLTLAGPLQLVQGGLGIVGRLPVFLDAPGGSRFWGFTEVVMRLPEALAPAQLRQLLTQGYDYQLWRVNPVTGARQVIEASQPGLTFVPVEQAVQLPNGNWTLSIVPTRGWNHPLGLSLEIALGLIVSVLLGYVAKLALDLKSHELGLEALISARTAEAMLAKNQLEATFNAIPDLIWVKDVNGVYLNCNPQLGLLYGVRCADIIGKTDHDFAAKDLADYFRESDRQAMEADEPTVNEVWLTFAGDRYRGLFETIKTPIRDAAGKLVGVLGISRDITDHKRTLEALRESEARLNVTLESTQIGIWEWDIKREIWHASAGYYTMLGYEPIRGAADRALWLSRVHPDDRQGVADKIQAMLAGGTAVPYQYETRVMHADGSYRWISVRGKAVARDARGKPTRMLGVRIDISDLKEAEERIHWLAHFDLLTGLPNRALLNARMTHAIDVAQRNQTPLALIFLDLDHFKNVNDTLGHRIGDELLMEVAHRMRSVVREEDMVSRQGGDEFVVVLPGTAAAAAAAVAEKLLEAIARHYQIEQYELVVTPSIGISLYPDHGEDFDALFKCADIAMYRAKRDGRNTYRFFTAEMQAHSARSLQLESALRRALERDEFRLNYQPQIALDDGRIIGAEALLRWHHPEWGMVSPAEFIPIAEDSGQILKIGEWVLRTAAAQMKLWIDSGLGPMVMAVNISALQFRDSRLPELLGRVLEEACLPPEYLELELTEGVAMGDPLGTIAIMENLHQRGIHMSIDDFGTGYSSLNYLKRFQIYKLKIDQSFVHNITEDPEDRAIVRAIIGLARSLNMQTIAEGVESADQLAFLREQGCDGVQGYYFSRPLTADMFEEYVRQDKEKNPH
jgi:diguanylate cyclase (GGDEF)-like protein/PAS domain S-box-containing protein